MNQLQEYLKLYEMSKKKRFQKLLESKLRNFEKYYISYLSKQTKKKYEIVIAKYNENISWSYPYRNITTIYNKSDLDCPDSIKLSNLGRESQTYLYHIISNWDNLAEMTLFTQGELSNEHSVFPIPVYLLSLTNYVSNLKQSGIEFRDGKGNHLRHIDKWLKEYRAKDMCPAIITFKEFWSIFSDKKTDFNNLWWSHGAIFSVSKRLIKQNSLELYIYLYKLVSSHRNPEEGHYFERSWYYIFNCGQLKNKTDTSKDIEKNNN